MRVLFLVVAVMAALIAPAAASARGIDEEHPLVIGHRGIGGYLPEHTLPGYALAIKAGADYIEPDLVSTKDGRLIARHEPDITNTTNVKDHPEFASRKRTATIDGAEYEGWFASDFTLAEIKTLRAVQPFADRPQRFNGRYRIPTFEQVIALAKRYSRRTGRRIGIYPETKHPTYHRALGLPLEGRLLRALRRAGWDRRRAPVFIQSFEQSNLIALNRRTNVRLVQLIDANDVNPDGTLDYTAPYDRPYDWTVSGDPTLLARTFGFFATDEGLDEVRRYADGIGPWKPYIQTTIGASPTLPPATDLVQRAHQRGLLVHPFTFRNEQRYLAPPYGGNPINEYLHFYELGVDGVFTDFADTAVMARELFRLQAGGGEEEQW
jgi:glycerophosphoryl diester phosphodiesterase